MKNTMNQSRINVESSIYDDDMSIYGEISQEARAIIESSRLLSQGCDDLFKAHIKYFTDSPVILKEINRILSIEKQSR